MTVVVRLDVRNEQRDGDDEQRVRRPWPVSPAKLISCCGESGQVAGVLQHVQPQPESALKSIGICSLADMVELAMKLFLDVEWADVLASELVSIALVSLDGKRVFYAERYPLPEDPTSWVKTVVYPLLERGSSAMNDAALTRCLREFLATIPEPWICYDSGHDRGLCQFVIDGMDEAEPEGPTVEVRWQCLDDMASACERWWKDHPEYRSQRHHAHFDAMALRGAYLSLWSM